MPVNVVWPRRRVRALHVVVVQKLVRVHFPQRRVLGGRLVLAEEKVDGHLGRGGAKERR